MNKNRFKFTSLAWQRGNTLIELLIATVIVGLVLTAVAMTMMYSIQREATNRYREYATQLAVEASEHLYLQRAIMGWQGFQTYLVLSGADTQWCFVYSDIDQDPILAPGECRSQPSNFYMNQFNVSFATDIKTSLDLSDPSKLIAEIEVTANVGDPNELTYALTQFYTEREY